MCIGIHGAYVSHEQALPPCITRGGVEALLFVLPLTSPGLGAVASGSGTRKPLAWGDPSRINGLPGDSLDGFGTCRSNTRPPGGRVAQLVEQRIENPRVGGSIPPPATIKFKTLVSARVESRELAAFSLERLSDSDIPRLYPIV